MDINLNFIIIATPVILFALTIHEYCHALVAFKLGDDTASLQGRLTLNPIMHLDPIGTIMMFLAGFGWARPVPVNPLNFKDPKKGMMLVAIAGPLSNIITAIIAGLVLNYILSDPGFSLDSNSGAYNTFVLILILNVVFGIALAVFNMIPIPPLDGSRVLYAYLPNRLADAYGKFEQFGFVFLIMIFIFAGSIFGKILWYPISILSKLITGFDYYHLSYIIRFLTNQ
ncbi:MAG: site-2 protease family protein [Candidatus Dadabacteria bacterium]|nr:site-2 protease family protein [Candidatus Dadabacteria bacterium]NIS09300.1 site-2 protease family protein [Candidatus Dadabacteria bacterium]NIV40790.1 site-2 protease family protein [Candidatus Dadabacteria bacterium]NIX14299.1 site-2 protease family protein [Candidatus Dadabacteria bacterium]NIY20832.1 site-2 protease family protein [Candidatus Dadabacteria bacterium]